MPVNPDDKPPKPRRNFPLFPNDNGSWCAKIDGKRKTFGGWAKDRRGEKAIVKYDAFIKARREGRDAPAQVDVGDPTVRNVCNEYLIARGGDPISPRTLADYRTDLAEFATLIGPARKVGDLLPSDFAEARAALAKRVGPHALGRKIATVRAAMRWAGPDGVGLLDREPRYGGQWNKPKAIERRRAKRLTVEAHGERTLTPVEIRRVLADAGVQLRAMILLGLNCGFLAIDCARLTSDAIDLDTGMIKFVRHKTENHRAAALWPETVTALRIAARARIEAAEPADASLIFLTRYGRPWVRDSVTDDKGVPKVGHVDAVSFEFGKLLRACGFKAKGERVGLNFSALRKTFRTAADDLGDRNAALLAMGHAFSGMDEFYVRSISGDRLRRLAVHTRLLLLRRFSLTISPVRVIPLPVLDPVLVPPR